MKEIKNDFILQQAKLVLLIPVRNLTFLTYTKLIGNLNIKKRNIGLLSRKKVKSINL